MNTGYLRRIYGYRELILRLTAKEVKLKYKSAALGWLWSVLHPLLLMAVFTVIFTRFIRLDIERFPLFLLAALLPWFFFSGALAAATTSIVENASLIKKAWFPQEILPLSVILAHGLNFVISLVLLLIFLVLSGVPLSRHLFWLPLLAAFEFLFIFGVSLAAGALHALYRDVRYGVELLLVVWFYATPIFYPLSFVPEEMRWIILLNPLSRFVGAFRDVILYQNHPGAGALLVIAGISAGALLAGMGIFSRFKKHFADAV